MYIHLQAAKLKMIDGRKMIDGVRYPVLKVTELKSLFQLQSDTGEWDVILLEEIYLNYQKYTRLMKETGYESLGMH